jgi:hypothetical protein
MHTNWIMSEVVGIEHENNPQLKIILKIQLLNATIKG